MIIIAENQLIIHIDVVRVGEIVIDRRGISDVMPDSQDM